jgi:predicted negative regulator of RcsB-dependent stress response
LVLAAEAQQSISATPAAVALLKRAVDQGAGNATLRSLVGLALKSDKSGLDDVEILELAERHFQASREDDVAAILMLAQAHLKAGALGRAREILEGATGRTNDERILRLLNSISE